jgi:hypothetical protein
VSEVGCDAQWPLVFAWTGNDYSEVSDRYKDYYRNYLKSLETQLAAYTSKSRPAAAQTANTASSGMRFYNNLGTGGPPPMIAAPAPAPTPQAAPTLDWQALQQSQRQAERDYPCARIEAAKTEAFLGINSTSTMSAAIKDSESDDPNKRILAAIIFSYLGTQEAEQDLKTLSNDADSDVAAAAKRAASTGEDPAEYYRRIIPGGASFSW